MRLSEAFLKALRWYIIAGSAVIGTSAFIIADNTGSVKPVMIGVLAYGVVYMTSYFWEEFRGKLLLLGILVFLAISFASPAVPYLLSGLSGHDPLSWDPYYIWGGAMAAFGIPAMTFVFYKII